MEDIRRLKVRVTYGDHIQEDILAELESVRSPITEQDRHDEAMILLAEATLRIAELYHLRNGYRIVPRYR